MHALPGRTSRLSASHVALHLLGFIAPALFVAMGVATAAPLCLAAGRRPAWWRSVLTNLIAGAAALAAGLWLFGVDGKMASYAALVVAVGTAQWLAGRSWRG